MLPVQAEILWDVQFSPDGSEIAAACYDDCVRIWEIPTGKELSVLRTESYVNKVEYSPDGKTLLSSDHSGVYLWDRTSGKRLQKFDGWEGSFYANATRVWTEGVSNAGSWSGPAPVRIWDAATGKQADPTNLFCNEVCSDPESRVITEYRVDNGTWDARFFVTELYTNDASFFRVWDSEQRGVIGTIPNIYGDVPHVKIHLSSDGTLLVISHDSFSASLGCDTVHFLDVKNGKPISSIAWPILYGPAISPDNKTVATYADDSTKTFEVILIDVPTGKITHRLKGHTDGVRDVAWSPDGQRVASVGMDCRAIIWKKEP
jgi:WD40 repeat protein